MRSRAGLLCALLAVALCREKGAAAISVGRGSTGSIRYTIRNSSTSAADILGAKVVVNAPVYFLQTSLSPDSAIVGKGGQSNYVLDYQIGGTAPSGQFSVTLTVDAATTELSPLLADSARTVVFDVDATPPSFVVKDQNGDAMPPDETITSPSISLSVADTGGGVERIALVTTGGTTVQSLTLGNVAAADHTFQSVPDGAYVIRAIDAFGNTSSNFPIAVALAPSVRFEFYPNADYMYSINYYGFGAPFDIPYADMKFSYTDPLSLISYAVLKKNGVAIHEETYSPPVSSDHVELELEDGDYAFDVQSPSGQKTIGSFTKYTATVTPILTRPQTSVGVSGGSFVFNIPIECSNNGAEGGFTDVKVYQVLPDGDDHALGAELGSPGCDGNFVGPLANGVYAAVGYDHGYDVQSFFVIDTIPVNWPMHFSENLSGVTRASNDTYLNFTSGNYVSPGLSDTPETDVFTSSTDLTVPEGAVGAALLTPPEPYISQIGSIGISSAPETPSSNTGHSQTYSISSDGGEFAILARQELHLDSSYEVCPGTTALCHDFDWQLAESGAPMMLESPVVARQILTTNSAPFRLNDPGKSQIQAGDQTIHITYVTALPIDAGDIPRATFSGTPQIDGQPEFKIAAGRSVIVVTGDPNVERMRALVAEMLAEGFQRAPGNYYKIDPPPLVLTRPAIVTMRYASGLSGDMELYQSEPGESFVRVSSQTLNVGARTITAAVTRLSDASFFAIFAPTGTFVSTAAYFAIDSKPPRTSLSATAPSTWTASQLYVSSVSQIGFTVTDDHVATNDGAGVGGCTTYFSIDGGSFLPATSTFSLSVEGAHIVSYFSVDRAGHAEAPKHGTIGVDLSVPYSVPYSSGPNYAIRAVDPAVDGDGSGIWKVYYLVDASTSSCIAVTEDTGAARGTCANPWYAGPFEVLDGTHTIVMRAYDRLGRVEDFHAQVVDNVPQNTRGGLGVGRDGYDTFWSVFQVDELPGFAHFNSSGVSVSSSAMSDAVYGLPWSVFFDTSARPYAIGTAGGETTEGADVAVYRANSSGEVDQQTFFDSGFELNDFIFGSAPGGWITGAAQYSGTVEEEGDVRFGMALWKFDPNTAAIALSTMHVIGGIFDVGTGVAVDPDGSLWISGYAAQEDESFSLMLSHYASDGHTLLGGPYFQPRYIEEMHGGTFAAVYASTDAVYVATSRMDGTGGSDLAFLRYDKLTGLPTSVNAWRGTEPAYPVAILPTDEGLLVAGGLGDEYTTGALWRYGFDGTLQSATLVDAGGAKGAVYRDDQLWLVVDGSTAPFRVTYEEAAPGGLIDLQPPRTTLIGDPDEAVVLSTIIYVNDMTWVGLSAVDDKAVYGDGLGAGTTQTFYAIDASTYFTRYTSTFTIVSEGTHSVRAYSVDLYGTAEPVSTHTVGVDLSTPDVNLFSLGSKFYFVGTDPVVGGVASGVQGIMYVVDAVNDCEGIEESTAAAPGTCANPFYEGPFTLAPGTHTVFFLSVDWVHNRSDEYEVDVEITGLATVTPSSGPIGSLITVAGTDFGPYYSTASFVRIGGSTAALGSWSDTSIVARVPALSSGPAAVYVQVETPWGTQLSATSYFTVTVPTITTVSPSSAPIGAPFTLTGQNFGAYTSTLAFVRFGASTAPITSWSETSIAGTVPGVLSTGSTSIRVERWAGTAVSSSAESSFLVLLPVISTMDPSFGPEDTIVTVVGQGFGPYDEDNTLLLVDGSSVDVSVWADRTIVWTVPGYLGDGEYPVVVRRTPAGGSVESSSRTFTVGSGFGGGSFFGAPQPLAAKPDKAFMGSLRLTRGRGGRVHAPAKAAVIVPAGALPGDAEISLKRLPSEPLRTRAFEDIRARSAGEPIEFGPEGERFDTPVTIELPYDPELVDAKAKVAIHYFNALRRVWEPLESVVDTVRKVVTATTNHFSIYQPLNIAPSTAAQDEFYYRDHYAYPNPSRNGAVVYFRIQPGLAQTVEVRVYDTAGRKVHDSSDFTFLGAIDDGNGKGAQNTYDHWWDVRGAGSGVYTFVLKASQAGQKPIIKSGKVAVIR